MNWAMNNAAFAHVNPGTGAPPRQVTLGAWNEQHCYPIASDFIEFPNRSWYMGDIPHGWACAEWLLLLRDMVFFEADEDGSPHIYLAPGILPKWWKDNKPIEVLNAPTIFGANFGCKLTHSSVDKTIKIEITQPVQKDVSFVFPCHFGTVHSLEVNGNVLPVSRKNIRLPAATEEAIVGYH